MKAACTQVALGRNHPEVVKAVAEMSRSTSSANDTYRTLRDDFRRWKTSANALRSLSAQDVVDVRNAYCTATDATEHDANAIADRWASQIKGAWSTTTSEADRIKRAADDLVARKRALKAAPKTKQAVDLILASLQDVVNGEIQGANNPTVKVLSEYGIAEHARRQSGCLGTELAIESKYCTNPNPKRRDCRLDCVRGCTVIEIKPRSAEEIDLGQAGAYAAGLMKMYNVEHEAMFERNGFAFFRPCVNDSALKMSFSVELYDYCEQTRVLAAPPELPAIDVPNEAE